jgi:hypothetical protein
MPTPSQNQPLAYRVAVDAAAALEGQNNKTFIALVGDQAVQLRTLPGHSIVSMIAIPKSTAAWTIFEVNPTSLQEADQSYRELESQRR